MNSDLQSSHLRSLHIYPNVVIAKKSFKKFVLEPVYEPHDAVPLASGARSMIVNLV